ncbi:thermonuclease family protein [Chloroflexota bacterium]
MAIPLLWRVATGLDILVNDEMVRQGLVQTKAYPPDTKYQDYIGQVEAEARETGRGMWAK